MSQPTAPSSTQALAIRRALWLTGLASPLLFGAVGWVVHRSLPRSGSAPHPPLLLPVLVVLAAGVSVVLLLLKRPLARQVRHNVARWFVLRYALAETVAVYGLLLLLLGNSWPGFLAFAAWALLLMVLIRPSAADEAQLREWEREP